MMITMRTNYFALSTSEEMIEIGRRSAVWLHQMLRLNPITQSRSESVYVTTGHCYNYAYIASVLGLSAVCSRAALNNPNNFTTTPNQTIVDGSIARNRPSQSDRI